MKMLMDSSAPKALRFVGQIFDGASQPLGGDAQGTVRLDDAAAERAIKTSGRVTGAALKPARAPRRSSGAAGRG